jgi:hypothetical protein
MVINYNLGNRDTSNLNLLSKRETMNMPTPKKEDNFSQILVKKILTKLRYHVEKNYKSQKEVECDLLSTSTNEHETSKDYIRIFFLN